MTNQVTSSPLDRASVWQARSLRVTAFPSPSAKIGEPKWWRELLGADAETRNQRVSRGELVEHGPFDTGLLTLTINPIRIDWTLSFRPEPDSGVGIPSLGGFQEAGDRFIKLMEEWFGLATSPPLRRVAFGAILDQLVDNHEEGCHILAKYLSCVQLSPAARDFLYQINRPRELQSSQTRKLSVNRLTKWSCVALQQGIIHHSLDGSQSTSSILGETRYACNLELDINTPADFMDELPRQALAQILREQYDLGKELAEKGDIP